VGGGPAAGLVTAQDELLDVAHAAARAAATELLERYGGPSRAVRAKSSPTDMVSEADVAAERAIRDLLTERRPDDAVLGEEGGDAAGTSGVRWIVDPLDGTTNFLYGIPQWCVSVACEDAAGALAGVILDPLRDEAWDATRDGPARLNGEPVESSALEHLGGALVATGFGYDPGVRARQAAALEGVLPRVRDIRRGGSAALDLAAAACGRVDAYWERGVQTWDVAAGALICARAGLDVRRLEPAHGLAGGLLAAPPAIAGALEALVA
jgi:myo-inositol-1(or 4)-monophosphatase